MKYWLGVFFLIICSCQKTKDTVPSTTTPDNFIRGADLSLIPEIEATSSPYISADNKPGDCLSILKAAGCNTVRLRLWYNPANNHSTLNEVAVFSEKIKSQHLKVLLCIHYSDTWADPGQQTPPIAWKDLGSQPLIDSVYQYTSRVVSIIQPDYVQIGNEINNGFLWESGRINNSVTFLELLKSGIKAVRDHDANTKIMLHYAGTNGAVDFFTLLKNNSVDYDLAGLSYYPIWHGKSLDLVQNVLTEINALTQKPVLIAETAYPFTLAYNDYTNNILGLSSQIIPGYPATPTGQLSYMQALITRIKVTPNGAGFIYWGGEWIAYKGTTSTSGSPWENQALFDFNNKSLPVMEVFKQ
jgi:arabinogalactan endo-1,4-beta-galactosidase